jgi:predicted nuclease of restriction endonuclease-like (RecB) superfamily
VLAAVISCPHPFFTFKDPYVLEFLDLKDEYSESDLENAIVHRLEDGELQGS